MKIRLLSVNEENLFETETTASHGCSCSRRIEIELHQYANCYCRSRRVQHLSAAMRHAEGELRAVSASVAAKNMPLRVKVTTERSRAGAFKHMCSARDTSLGLSTGAMMVVLLWS
jgi:hypothetical protein